MDMRLLSHYWENLQNDLVAQLGPDVGMLATEQVMQGWADAMANVELARIMRESV